MVNKQTVTDSILQQGILPLYFNADETVSVDVLKAIYKAGIKAVEYTNRGEAALVNFKKLVEVRNNGSYLLAELDGTIRKSSVAGNCVKKFYSFLPITRLNLGLADIIGLDQNTTRSNQRISERDANMTKLTRVNGDSRPIN